MNENNEREVEIINNNASNNNKIESNEKKNSILAWLPLILSIVYAVSPIDIVPDTIPFAGWIEDTLLLTISSLNAIQYGILQNNNYIAKVIKYIKWGLMALLIIGILIIILLTILVFKVTTK